VLRAVLAFVRLSRLKFLSGGLVGGAFGTAMSLAVGARFDILAYAFAQLTITSFHLMTHYANDYFDRAADVRSVRTPYSGGSGTLVDGSLSSRVALVAAGASASIGCAGALALAAHAPIAAGIAVAIGALAWAYSAPPLRLLARGLGELDTALVVAVLVPLCAFAAQRPPLGAFGIALASTLPAAAAIFAMMLAVEYPDLASDAVGGKRNLVVRAGPRRACAYGIAAVVATYAAVGVAIATGAPPALGFVEATSVPLGIGLARRFAARAASGSRYDDEALAGTGVAFFFMVSLDVLLAYLAGLRA
jgi:1,4-dihydroxy-2-naphthoate octaprenyltransferase